MIKLKKLVITALCMAMCVVLPFAFHMIPDFGSIFSPIHIPVLICGIICGWQYGLVCGVMGPLLSSVITNMPPLGYLPPMLVELAFYGFCTGLCMKLVRTKKYIINVYISLICAMLLGRVIAGLAKAWFFMAGNFSFAMWIESYFIVSLPGIVIHLLLIPAVVLALKNAKVLPNGKIENGFADYLRKAYALHPSMQPQDVHKLCYQAVYGAEHLLLDIDSAREYFNSEYERTDCHDGPLYEEISAEVCRINLGAWKATGLKKEWLFNMFAASLREKKGSYDQFASYIEIAKKVLPRLDWKNYSVTDEAVHHSDEYRNAEKPAYRIVNKRFVRLISILKEIKEGTSIIALEGRCAAGKSTAADDLSVVLSASVVHMDDFFLPPEMRSEERLAEAGGNVHYERFCEEVLPNLGGKDFAYRIFDCSKMALCGEREVHSSDICIVEGAYSLHPRFGEYADLKVFFDISKEEQMMRIIARNGAQMAEMFEKRWIPMEEKYYSEYCIKEKCDLVVR